MADDLPVVIGPAGMQPQTPAALLGRLIQNVTAVRPGYTANLPGSMVEDISSTDVYALLQIDSGVVELVNSLTPFGANVFILNQLGVMLGIAQGQGTNTSVFVEFSGPPGYVIPAGFIVSDGTHQYVVQDGGVIETGGESALLFCLAVNPGSWAVPTSTVTQLITSVPPAIVLSVVNPEAGLPGLGTETEASYRARVLQANLAESQGMATYLKTKLMQVSGVQPRLVSVVQVVGGGWEIICGGGDPYAVGYAIFRALFDISLIQESLIRVTNISNASPGIVTTDLTHNYTTGDVITIAGVVGMTGINSVPFTATVLSSTSFSIGIDTTGSGVYVSGGIVSPNLRNLDVALNDYPNTYDITYINPPQQAVEITLSWDTSESNFVSSAAVAQLAQPAIVDYVNNISAGQPINLNVMATVFSESVSSVLSANLITNISVIVKIDGVTTPTTVGTQIVPGDPESYFQTQTSSVTIVKV